MRFNTDFLQDTKAAKVASLSQALGYVDQFRWVSIHLVEWGSRDRYVSAIRLSTMHCIICISQGWLLWIPIQSAITMEHANFGSGG